MGTIRRYETSVKKYNCPPKNLLSVRLRDVVVKWSEMKQSSVNLTAEDGRSPRCLLLSGMREHTVFVFSDGFYLAGNLSWMKEKKGGVFNVFLIRLMGIYFGKSSKGCFLFMVKVII